MRSLNLKLIAVLCLVPMFALADNQPWGIGQGTNRVASGPTAQRPNAVEGTLYDNTTIHAIEAYLNGSWTSLVGGIINLATQVTGTLPVANGGTGGDGSVNDKTDNYQLLASDCGKVVRYNKASAVVATIPLNATTSIGNFCSIVIEQLGAGSLSIQCSDSATCASTVAVNKTSSTLTLTGQYGTVLLYKSATNTWLAKGDLQ